MRNQIRLPYRLGNSLAHQHLIGQQRLEGRGIIQLEPLNLLIEGLRILQIQHLAGLLLIRVGQQQRPLLGAAELVHPLPQPTQRCRLLPQLIPQHKILTPPLYRYSQNAYDMVDPTVIRAEHAFPETTLLHHLVYGETCSHCYRRADMPHRQASLHAL